MWIAYSMKLLKVAAGLIKIRLLKKANLLAVIECFDGPGTFSDCVLGLKECSNSNPCPYHNTVQLYRGLFFKQLKEESIEQSAKRINQFNFKLINNT